MDLKLKKIKYDDLNSRQKENYNYQNISAILASYGFATIRLSDDWQTADFIAQHIDGKTFLKVQQKARVSFNQKYRGKDIYICGRSRGAWYLYPHDIVLNKLLRLRTTDPTGIKHFKNTRSWIKKGGYRWGKIPKRLEKYFAPYQLS
tara:strand:- start:11 stop:451 length:441 start_codon:yes stop_codon:yes gene_type:complete